MGFLPFGGSKNAIGLDIGSSFIKILELDLAKGKWSLVNFGMKKLPPEAVVDGQLMNSNVIVDSIRELISEQKIKTRDVVTSVSGHSVIIKKINLPLMSRAELEESIQWEAEQYIPFDINDVNIDVQILDPAGDAGGQMEVLLVAAKKDMINDYTAIVQEAGLSPVVMDVDSFAIENAFELNYDVAPDDTVVLVNIGASLININILRGGVTAFTRDITLGGNQYTEEIQKQLNVSYEEAEALKIGGDIIRDAQAVVPEEVESIIRQVSNNVATEIQRSLDFYAATAAEDEIRGIFVSGGTARVPGLARAIQEKTGLAVELVNAFRRIEIDEKAFNVDFLTEVGSMASVAVGLAMRRSDDQ
ncbi:MAG: pilus assembly protein PilM [Rickettsiales bacterium]|nr:pilus assembly protein PilM [Rickettsiales bacterium]|tara:strand:- start:287 stop:1366 length:1080 start_codon:yes stop_codon:yes gene_type:complete